MYRSSSSLKWKSITSSIEKAGPGGSGPRGSSGRSTSGSNISAVAEEDCPVTSTPAETSRATILRSARFATGSMHVGQSNRYVPSRPPLITRSRIDSGPMSTSPQRGHVVRIVVITPAISDTGARCLSPRAEDGSTSSVPFPGPACQLADPVVQVGRLHDLGIRPEPQDHTDVVPAGRVQGPAGALEPPRLEPLAGPGGGMDPVCPKQALRTRAVI